MCQLHVEGDIGWIQQHILVRLMIQGDRVEINEDEGIKMSNLPNKVTVIVQSDSMFVDLTITNLNDTLAFEKECNEKYVSARTVDILKT